MNTRNLFVQIVGLILMMALFVACGTTQSVSTSIAPTPTNTSIPPTNTLSPTDTPAATPTPSHPVLHPASEKEIAPFSQVVYTLPRMEEVRYANVHYKDFINAEEETVRLTMDIYYPPDYDFESKIPMVLFVNGFSDADWAEAMIELGQIISWGKLSAVSGMAAIAYETRDYETDIYDVLSYIHENSDSLGIDDSRMVMWSCSSNTPVSLDILSDAGEGTNLKGFVVYYGDITDPDRDLSPEVPLFMVMAGYDSASTNMQMEAFAENARTQNVPVEFIDYEKAPHGFDTYTSKDDEETHRIIERTLEFMKTQLEVD